MLANASDQLDDPGRGGAALERALRRQLIHNAVSQWIREWQSEFNDVYPDPSQR